MTSISRKLRKLDKIFFKCKNVCKKEYLRIAELNAENLFLKIRECSWNSGMWAAVMMTWQISGSLHETLYMTEQKKKEKEQ